MLVETEYEYSSEEEELKVGEEHSDSEWDSEPELNQLYDSHTKALADSLKSKHKNALKGVEKSSRQQQLKKEALTRRELEKQNHRLRETLRRTKHAGWNQDSPGEPVPATRGSTPQSTHLPVQPPSEHSRTIPPEKEYPQTLEAAATYDW